MIKVNKPKIRLNEFENIWTKSRLGELYEVYSGNTPSRSDSRNYQNGEIPWIKTTDLNNSLICSNEEKISVYGVTKLKLLPANTVLIAMYGGFNQIGRTGLLAYPATINQALAALMPVNEINPNFLLNFLNFKKESWRNVAASSRKDPNITKNDVEKFIISFPSFAEQSAIGSLFCTLDELLSSYKDNLANYQSLKATMLSKMFPKAGKTVPEIRLDGFEDEWEVKKLKNVVQINPKSALPEKFKYIDLESVVGTRINKIREEYKETAPSRAQRLAEKGDIFYQTVRPYQKNNYLFKLDDMDYVFSSGYAQLRPKRTNCDSDFLLTLLQDNKFLSKVLDRCTGTSYPAINSKDLVEISIVIPKVEEQQAIGSYFSNLDNLINSHQEKISQLETLKKKLLQDMFI